MKFKMRNCRSLSPTKLINRHISMIIVINANLNLQLVGLFVVVFSTANAVFPDAIVTRQSISQFTKKKDAFNIHDVFEV